MIFPNPLETEIRVVPPGFVVIDKISGERSEVTDSSVVARPGLIYMTQLIWDKMKGAMANGQG